jgi:ribosomal protein S18 acetylase RimI-like enzyme
MSVLLRRARPDDREAIDRIVGAAYAVYIPRMGKPPGPMLDDYAARIAADEAWILEEGGVPVAALVLVEKPDHLLLDNVAVDPARQGRGLGRRLIAHAEGEARARGFAELRLYTHETMTENMELYRLLGFMETHRATEAGYARVYMRKPV